MEKMNHLKELLKHDVVMLHSAEQQLVEAMPAMIAKAQDSSLKQALQQHLDITKRQVDRITQVKQLLGADDDSVTDHTGVLASLMGSPTKCKGMEGIIEEGEKIMASKLDQDVMDAAILAGSQKVEHFEIACYGTARAYAQQLGLTEVEQLLKQTLDEEYTADRQLTQLAEARINAEATV